MRGLLRRTAGWLARDEGFTLTELLVAMTIGTVVLGGGVMMFTAALQSQPKASARAANVQQARTASERIVRELRQGSTAPTATSSQLSILTYVHSATCGGAWSSTSIPCRVTYTCTAGTCTRVEAQPNGTAPGPASQVVSGLSNGIVFSYSPSSSAPSWVGITLQFPAEGGDDAITLEDGAALRNPASAS
jgi:prepilin-type N-terminal cleavage/methylation domain-containing protein